MRAASHGSRRGAVENRAEQDENRESPQPWLCSTSRSRNRERVSLRALHRSSLLPHAEEATGCGRHPLESSCAGLTRASIEKNSFEADGLPGHQRVHARLRRAMPGNDEIAASELAARRRTVFGNSNLTMSNSPSRSRGAFLRPGFATLLHQPRIEGWAERRETFGCSAEHPWGVSCASKTRVNALMTRYARRLRGALRPI